MLPIRIVLIPAVTEPVRYSTCEPIQNHASGCGPEQAQAEEQLDCEEPGRDEVVDAADRRVSARRSAACSEQARCRAGGR